MRGAFFTKKQNTSIYFCIIRHSTASVHGSSRAAKQRQRTKQNENFSKHLGLERGSERVREKRRVEGQRQRGEERKKSEKREKRGSEAEAERGRRGRKRAWNGDK